MPNDLDNVEDLTLFANESFDTDDVDLFEFTGDDTSPLTRLKSIILSLDWEISDKILQELTDEIDNLQQMWQGDKVAKVYLQGLNKIGTYLRNEGAYAHPNAIKLLLSFFYNFEKIISSENITGDTITSMLKADVRKFKILQYQINQIETGAPILHGAIDEGYQQEAIEDSEKSATECEPLNCLKATILGLEWEVTDKGLDQFNAQVADVREQFMENKSAQILIQGLQALGGYITDERADAHPEAFTMLHSFYEGIELLLDEDKIDEEERQNILVDRVNRLNNLKAIIAATSKHDQETDTEELIEDVLEPAALDADENKKDEEDFSDLLVEEDAESDTFFNAAKDDIKKDATGAAIPIASALAGVKGDSSYPDDILDPSAIVPVNDEVTDDFLEEELRAGTTLTPASDKTNEEIPELDTTTEEDFSEDLDLFFTDEDEDLFKSMAGEKEKEVDENLEDLELTFSDDELDLDLSEEDMAMEETAEAEFDQLFIEEEDENLTLAPSLTDTDDEGGLNEEETLTTLPEEPADEIDDKLDAFFGIDEEDEQEIKQEGESLQEEDLVAPALADAEEEGGFNEEEAVATMAEEPTAEIDDKLDAFFGSDEESEQAEVTEEVLEEEEILVAPALADAEEEGGFNEEEAVATMVEEPTAEIDDKLDAFFGSDEESEQAEAVVEAPAEEDLVAPALADAEEEGGFNEEEAVATMAEEPTAEIEDKLDAFFGTDTNQPAETGGMVEEKAKGAGLLQTLGVGLAALAAKPTLDRLKENKALVEQISKEPGMATEQTVLLQLLNSVLTLAPEDKEYLPDTTSELSNYLYRQIEGKNISADVLVTAVSRVTDWQKALMENIRKGQTKAEASATVPAAETLTHVTSEVHSGFDNLRSVLAEEFAELRKELKEKDT